MHVQSPHLVHFILRLNLPSNIDMSNCTGYWPVCMRLCPRTSMFLALHYPLISSPHLRNELPHPAFVG